MSPAVPPKSRRSFSPAALLLSAAVVCIITLQIRLVGDWRVDDSYITFAFSKNVARGRGPIFSHDVRVEGYTNFLWMVLNAIPIKLFPLLDPIVAARCGAFLSGWHYLTHAVWDLGGAFVALPVLLAAVRRRRDRRMLFLVATILFELAVVVRVQGDWMPFNRFWIPVGSPVALLFCIGLADIAEICEAYPRARYGAYAIVTALWLVVALHVDSHHVTTEREAAKLKRAEKEKQHTYQNLFVNRDYFAAILREPGEVLVTDYGGIFGYYTEASLIEMWGLCNVDIALRGDIRGINPIYGKTCVECYREFDPEYFHVRTPIVRQPNAYANHREVVRDVFQGPAIDRVIDLRHNYVTGRVLDPSAKRALFFLEKRRPGKRFIPQTRPGGFVVDYPFEPSGTQQPISSGSSG